MKHLSSLDNPRVKSTVRLREQRHRRKTGHFAVESTRQIARALDAGLVPVELMWCEDMLGGAVGEVRQIHEQAQQRSADYRGWTVSEPVVRKMAYREHPQGVVAVFEQPTWSLSQVLEPVTTGAGLCLVAVGIEKPGNLGAMARSAAAAGAAGIVLADSVVDAFNPNVIRASTGAVFTLPVVSVSTEQALADLGERGVTMFAATPQASQSCFDADLTGPLALIVGSEDRGLQPAWLDAAQAIKIPMNDRTVDSLNASTAAAVLLFEAVRQRLPRT